MIIYYCKISEIKLFCSGRKHNKKNFQQNYAACCIRYAVESSINIILVIIIFRVEKMVTHKLTTNINI